MWDQATKRATTLEWTHARQESECSPVHLPNAWRQHKSSFKTLHPPPNFLLLSSSPPKRMIKTNDVIINYDYQHRGDHVLPTEKVQRTSQYNVLPNELDAWADPKEALSIKAFPMSWLVKTFLMSWLELETFSLSRVVDVCLRPFKRVESSWKIQDLPSNESSHQHERPYDKSSHHAPWRTFQWVESSWAIEDLRISRVKGI